MRHTPTGGAVRFICTSTPRAGPCDAHHGEPSEPRTVFMDGEAVFLASCRCTARVGTADYRFVWSMGGENLEFDRHGCSDSGRTWVRQAPLQRKAIEEGTCIPTRVGSASGRRNPAGPDGRRRGEPARPGRASRTPRLWLSAPGLRTGSLSHMGQLEYSGTDIPS